MRVEPTPGIARRTPRAWARGSETPQDEVRSRREPRGGQGAVAPPRASRLARAGWTPVVLALVAFVIYVPGFWWGAPHATAPDRTHAWGVDDETPLGPLGEMAGIFRPRPNRNLGYPLMYSFVVAAAYAPYLAYLRATGGLSGMAAEYPFGLRDPVATLAMLTAIAHLVSVLMAVGIVLAACDIGRTLWDRRTGIIAALLATVSFPMFYYARTGNVDVPVLFFTAAALAGVARILAGGFTVARGAWAGAFAGFAVATKEPAAAAFLALPLVLLPLHLRSSGLGAAALASLRWWKAPAAAALAGILAFGFGSGLFVAPERYFAHLDFIRGRVQALASGSVVVVGMHPWTLDGHVALLRVIWSYLVDAMTLPGLLLAGVGIAVTLRRRPLLATMALPALTYAVVLFVAARAAQLRYIMPAAFPLTIFTAVALSAGWTARTRWVRAAARTCTIGLVAVGLLRGADLTAAMLHDSRYAAGAWLAEHARPGDRLEYFGQDHNLPPLAEHLASEPAVAAGEITERWPSDEELAREIASGWRARRPDFILVMPDYFSLPGAPHPRSCPPEVFQALLDGGLGYRMAAFFQSPRLLPWLPRPDLDYPSVNPPIRLFVPSSDRTGSPGGG